MDSLNQFVEFAINNKEEVLGMCIDLQSQEMPLGSKWL
jgi:hypothetical protein